MALGQSCVRPWELSMFYAMLARGGLRPKPVFIRMVLQRDGKVIEDKRSFDDPSLSAEGRFNRLESALFQREERLIRKNTSYLITYALRRVVLYGTGYKVKKLKKPAVGKKV